MGNRSSNSSCGGECSTGCFFLNYNKIVEIFSELIFAKEVFDSLIKYSVFSFSFR